MTLNSNIKNAKLVPIIIAGGVGSRLWPLSRESHPKPFIKLADKQSLIQKSYLRAASLPNVDEIVTVTNRDLFFYTKDEYDALNQQGIKNSFILEPMGRNSAAAIALAAQQIQNQYGSDAIILVLPADHLIEDLAAFEDAVALAVSLASGHKLVTFGIKPNTPKTGYGYIHARGNEVLQFVEKPNLAKAQEYLAAGDYFWNSGMFCMHVGTILQEIEQYCPDIYQQTGICLANAKVSKSDVWVQREIQASDFSAMQNISIDYAVFEKSKQVAVVPCDIGWSDIGSCLEFGQLYAQDAQNNHILGDTVLEDVQNCIIHSEGRLIAGIGLQDVIIVDTSDVTLVIDRARAQDIGKVVKTLKERSHPSYQVFPTVHRPWGNYTVLQEGNGFKLKRIEVKPGEKLSLQSHNFRSEHWVVVSGVAKVINGEQTLELQKNQSTFIPIGNKHRLENIGHELLVLIEVQCGDYLGEDDIIRYEDIYNRVSNYNEATIL
jgi:mannose-1-phosphate guanylyltransferase